MNNFWNKCIYKMASPIYDKFFNSGVFLNTRKEIFHEIPFEKEHKILFVGVGTGADLELVNHTVLDITAIDYSPYMLGKAKKKFVNSTIKFKEMDAQQLKLKDEEFDFIVASLILSVVPDANKSFKEMVRVLKVDGKIIVFDKFVPKNQKLSIPKLLLRPIISVLGTDIGRSFEELLLTNENVKVEEDYPIMLDGMYRKIIISKTNEYH